MVRQVVHCHRGKHVIQVGDPCSCPAVVPPIHMIRREVLPARDRGSIPIALGVLVAALVGLGVASACFGDGRVVEERVRLEAIARDLALIRDLTTDEHR